MKPNLGAALSLRAAGWTFEGERPGVKKCIILAVPHTSNWDGLLLLLLAQSLGLPMSWTIKESWVRGPMGLLLRRLGAVAIDRSRANNLVQQMVDEFARRDELVLVIPPEGTRSRTEHWKSGFYNIALGAGVPVVPGYLDYQRKRAGLGAPMQMTGDVAGDMDKIREFYRVHAAAALHPDDFGPIRLRVESEAK